MRRHLGVERELQTMCVHICFSAFRNIFYTIINTASQFFNADQIGEMGWLSRTFCHIYATLSVKFYDAGTKMFKMHPKLHLFQHLCEYTAKIGNPRYWWTYQDESLVGDCIGVANTVHPLTLAVSVLTKGAARCFETRWNRA